MRESKKISVLFLCLLVILGSVFYPSAGAYTAAQNIISGEVYYVKNKFSGKYLDVEHGVDANGTNVSQYQYKGAGNQRWRVSYVGGGLYNLTPQISNTRMQVSDSSRDPLYERIMQIFDDPFGEDSSQW